jgi:hypothetical protein
VVEGSGNALVDDEIQHRFEILQHLARRYSQGPDARFLQPTIPRNVSAGCVAAVMRFAVDFNGESLRFAVEVEDVRAGRMLAAKLQPRRTLPQYPPEQHFG